MYFSNCGPGGAGRQLPPHGVLWNFHFGKRSNRQIACFWPECNAFIMKIKLQQSSLYGYNWLLCVWMRLCAICVPLCRAKIAACCSFAFLFVAGYERNGAIPIDPCLWTKKSEISVLETVSFIPLYQTLFLLVYFWRISHQKNYRHLLLIYIRPQTF